MNLIWFSWCISAILFLGFVVSLFVSYAPSAENFRVYEQSTLAAMAVGTVGVAVFLTGFPRHHWVHHSRPPWLLWLALGITLAASLVVFG
jgi:hypothetical protein